MINLCHQNDKTASDLCFYDWTADGTKQDIWNKQWLLFCNILLNTQYYLTHELIINMYIPYSLRFIKPAVRSIAEVWSHPLSVPIYFKFSTTHSVTNAIALSQSTHYVFSKIEAASSRWLRLKNETATINGSTFLLLRPSRRYLWKKSMKIWPDPFHVSHKKVTTTHSAAMIP